MKKDQEIRKLKSNTKFSGAGEESSKDSNVHGFEINSGSNHSGADSDSSDDDRH